MNAGKGVLIYSRNVRLTARQTDDTYVGGLKARYVEALQLASLGRQTDDHAFAGHHHLIILC